MDRPTLKLTWRWLFALVAICVTSFCTLAVTQDERVLSPAEVAQAIDRLRTSTTPDVIAEAVIVGARLLRSARFTEASQLFSVLAEKRPNDAGILYGLALATFNTGKVTEAEPIVRRAIDVALKEPNANDAEGVQRSADALVLLGVILAVKGDDAAALKAIQQALSLAPNHFDARLALGRALFGMGDNAGAIRAFQAAKVLQPTNGQVLFYLATALERSGDIKAALSTYRELIAIRNDSYDGHLGLGVLLLKSGRRDDDEGLKELERALQINPNLYEGRVALGRALVLRGRWNDSLEHLLRAAALAPENPEPHYQLSIAYRRLGRKDEAAKEAAIVKRIHESRRGKGSNVAVAP
jgi:tetratricopeptide (TPR) repeat protein